MSLSGRVTRSSGRSYVDEAGEDGTLTGNDSAERRRRPVHREREKSTKSHAGSDSSITATRNLLREATEKQEEDERYVEMALGELRGLIKELNETNWMFNKHNYA